MFKLFDRAAYGWHFMPNGVLFNWTKNASWIDKKKLIINCRYKKKGEGC